MRAIGIIPARMGSTRFPGKPLAPIAGQPMLAHVWRVAAIESELISSTFVATADKEIIDWCEFLGIKYIATHADCRNGTERVHDAMRQLKALEGDIVLNIQGDEPTLRAGSLDALVRAFEDPAVEIASLCFAPSSPVFTADRDRVKVLVGPDGFALGFFRSVHMAHLWQSYRQHIGVYAFRREILAEVAGLPPAGDLEQVSWMNAGRRIRMVEIPYETVAVDRLEDIPGAEAIIRSQSGLSPLLSPLSGMNRDEPGRTRTAAA